MKYVVAVLLLLALCAPIVAEARDNTECDVWLVIGDIPKWLACRAGAYLLRATAIEDQWLIERLLPGGPVNE